MIKILKYFAEIEAAVSEIDEKHAYKRYLLRKKYTTTKEKLEEAEKRLKEEKKQAEKENKGETNITSSS